MKNYTFKLDAHIWLDRNFTVEANSIDEAQKKAKDIQLEHLKYSSKVSNGGNGHRQLEQLQYYLREWTYGDLGFDIVYVEEEK